MNSCEFTLLILFSNLQARIIFSRQHSQNLMLNIPKRKDRKKVLFIRAYKIDNNFRAVSNITISRTWKYLLSG